jgi:hypothetical protein
VAFDPKDPRHRRWGSALATGDFDGLTDADEINVHASDPNNSDSDDDTFSDGDEVSAGTDPNDPGSFPAAPVPTLGLVYSILLGGLLLGTALVGVCAYDVMQLFQLGYDGAYISYRYAVLGRAH